MATLKEQDIVLLDHDADGNPIIQMPITRIENVEGAVKTINGDSPDALGNVTVSGKAVGDQWISVDGSIPDGGLAFNGGEVMRSIYSELFAWATEKGRVITETEWQSLYSSQNGNVPYYSSGDGSTTFRLPNINAYPRFVADGAGAYTEEGLPNITGGFSIDTKDASYNCVGAITRTDPGVASFTADHRVGSDGNAGYLYKVYLDASKSNAIYGNSSHVTPETTTILVGVIAIAQASEGDTSLSDVLAAVDTLESRTLKIVRYS